MIIIIAICVAAAVSLACYAACVAAGTADDREKELFDEWLKSKETKE